MELRNVIVRLWDDVRVIIHPEGGLQVEKRVWGIGWTLMEDAEEGAPSADDLADLMARVRGAVELAWDKVGAL